MALAVVKFISKHDENTIVVIIRPDKARVFWVSRKCPGNGKFISKHDENMIVVTII